MAVQMPKLKRSLFGYRPSLVQAILTGQEAMFARVSQRLLKAESDRDTARADLEACRDEIEVKAERARRAEVERDREAERARTAVAEAQELRSINEGLQARIYHLDAEAADAAAARGGAPGPEDLWSSLERAERSLIDVIDRARRENEQQLEAIEAARRQLRAETERLAGWRAEANGILGTVRAALARFAGVAARLPDEGREAIPTATITLPDASPNGNGAVEREEVTAIQELYGSG
jgi:chromosome segregation ATPase